MPKTLLAVDDSVTMRKVLEITFSGEDFRVLTADGTNDAMSHLGESPQVVVVDSVLGDGDGYSLCKQVRQKLPTAAIVLMASRYNPYDQARGRDAGADDFIDKPFDTQQLIDKVKKILVAREGGQPVAAAAAPAAAPAAAAAAPAAAAAAPAHRPQVAVGGAAKPGMRSPTLMFGQEGPASSPRPPGVMGGAPAHAAPAASAAPAPPAAAAVAKAAFGTTSPSATSGGGVVSASVNGHLATKLGELGLTPQQADAVLALSREVVERVVWEVVPQLAETLIREEITRLTRD